MFLSSMFLPIYIICLAQTGQCLGVNLDPVSSLQECLLSLSENKESILFQFSPGWLHSMICTPQ
jgi:hypothetical protein